MSIESVTLSNHLILYCPLSLLPSVFPCIRIFSSKFTVHIRWPKYWSSGHQPFWKHSLSLKNLHELNDHSSPIKDFPGGSDSKVSAYNVGDPGSIPGLGRSPGEENGNPLQYSSLGNPTDGGSWQATVHGVTKSRTRLRDFTFFLSFLSTIKGPFWSADHLRIISHPTQLLPRFPFMVFCYLLTSTEALSPKASSLSIEYEFSQFFSSGSFVPKSPLLCVLCVSTVILD